MSYYRAAAQAAAAEPARLGVLLVNLGTPDSPSYGDVRRYLREFLGDRRVINTSRLIWLPLLYGVILPFRPLRTARNYRKIWLAEGSPLAVYSRELAEKVGARLRGMLGEEVVVELAMTYGNPGMEAAIERLAARNVRRLVVLPLYPQYCSSTTGSVFDALAGVLRRWRWLPALRMISDYHDEPGYIEAWASRIEERWRAQGARSHLLVSYHGIPASYVAEGDPYQAQTERTTQLLAARLGLASDEYSLCYQSRFGSVVWLQPYTTDKLKELVGRGIRSLTVISPSFAVDCLETLEEVAIEYREQFLALGGERFELLPCLNGEDGHAALLAGLVQRSIAGWR